jgi:hypothetical protein
MLADINLIPAVSGNNTLDRAKLKKRGPKNYKRVESKINQHQAGNREREKPRQDSGKDSDQPKKLEVYA